MTTSAGTKADPLTYQRSDLFNSLDGIDSWKEWTATNLIANAEI